MLHVDDGELNAYADGELAATGHNIAELEAHLAICAECRKRMEEVRGTSSRAAAILAGANPPDLIIPPFEGVIGRGLAPRGSVNRNRGDTPMSTTTAEMGATAPLGKPRFNHLVSSGGGSARRAWNPGSATLSVLLHSALIIGAVYATVGTDQTKEIEELVEFMEIEDKAPEEEKQPEAPKPDEPPPPPAATQALTPPEAPPASIPDVDLSAPAVSAQDFSGIGIVAEQAAPPPPVEAPPPAADFAYELAVLERVPQLTNQGTIASVMERLYPRLLQDAGIGGTVTMQFVIEPDGTVDMESVRVLDSSHEQLSDASIKAVERFRFRPGRYKGENVRVLIQMPITWQPAG